MMEVERQSRGSRLSNNGKNTERYSGKSILSLERMSSPRNRPLRKRASLINVMDIQWKGKSEEFMFTEETNRFSGSKRFSNKSKELYSYRVQIEEKDLDRQSHCKISHQCNCSAQQCSQDHCICWLTPREICVIGQCCPKCIQMKNKYLKETRGFQLKKEQKKVEPTKQNLLSSLVKEKNCKNMHYFKQVYANQDFIKDLVFCTCKKSQCQKKYCLCYQKGLKCGQFCCCLECQNQQQESDEFRQEEQRRWERYATYKPFEQEELVEGQIDENIDRFLENEEQFNETMQFEPVNFDAFISHNAT